MNGIKASLCFCGHHSEVSSLFSGARPLITDLPVDVAHINMGVSVEGRAARKPLRSYNRDAQ